jgi:hypothetical protein
MKVYSISGKNTGRAALQLILSLAILGGCQNKTVDQVPGPIEFITRKMNSGLDESILFSSAVLADQTGTDVFSRTVESVHRGLVNGANFVPTDVTGRLAYRVDVRDTLSGTLTFKVGSTFYTRSYAGLAYGSVSHFYNGTCFSCDNEWGIWRMFQRQAEQPNGQREPQITSMWVGTPPTSYRAAPSENLRIFRDSVLTVAANAPVSLDVTVTTNSPDDSFFVTYPVVSGYMTQAMTHSPADSLNHRATVSIQSGRRFELLAVQGFKRETFTDTNYNEATSTAIQTAIIAFR